MSLFQSIEKHKKEIIGENIVVGGLTRQVKLFDQLFQELYAQILPNTEVIRSNPLTGIYLSRHSQEENPNRLAVILEEFESLEFEFDYSAETTANEDPEAYRVTEFLSPVREGKVSPAVWKIARKRATSETALNGTLNFPLTAYSMIGALVVHHGLDKVKKCKYLRILKWYVSQIEDDLFREARNGTIRDVRYDCCSPTRCYMLLRCAYLELEGQYPSKVLWNVFEYISVSPFARQMQLKKITSNAKQAIFDLSSSGFSLYYDKFDRKNPYPNLPKFRKRAVKKEENDHVHFEFIREAYEKDIADMRLARLDELASLYEKMVSETINPKNLLLYSILQAPGIICGFVRGNEGIIHANQMAESAPDDNEFPKQTSAKYIRDEAGKLLAQAVQLPYVKGGVLTQKHFLKIINRLMTTKSAGGFRAEYTVRVPERMTESKKRIFAGTKKFSEQLDLILRDKAAVFQSSPDHYIDPKVLWAHKNSKNNPNRVGNRNTMNRKPRVIKLIDLIQYIKSAGVVLTFQDVMNKRDVEYKGALGGLYNWTVGSETGTPILDHIHSITGSGDPDIICSAADYSSFDQTERFNNTRRHVLAGIINKAKDLGVWDADAPFLGKKNWLHAFIDEQMTRHVLFFKVGQGKDEKIFASDMLQSGEFWTLVFNNICNRANVRDFYQQLHFAFPDLSNEMILYLVFFMGDDSIGFLKKPTNWNVEKYANYVNLFSKVSGDNGFDLNPLKTIVKINASEYLKKPNVYGYHVPLYMQTDALVSERRNENMTTVSRDRDMNSKLQIMIYRGHNPQILHTFMKMKWNIGRVLSLRHGGEITGGIKEKKKTATPVVALPFALFYTPVTMKGVGQLSDCPLFPSKDGIIGFRAANNDELRMHINAAAHVISAKTPQISSLIAKRLTKGDEHEVSPPRPLDNMKAFARNHIQDKSRISTSKTATGRLFRDADVDVSHIAYYRMPEIITENSLKSNPKISRLDFVDYAKIVPQLIELMKDTEFPDVVEKEYGFYKGISIVNAGKISKIHQAVPMPTLHQKLIMLQQTIGIHGIVSRFSRDFTKFYSALRLDANFPRYIQPETIAEYLSKPKIRASRRNIVNFLIAIGASQEKAADMAVLLLSSMESFNVAVNGKLFSVNDHFLPILDHSLQRKQKLVNLLTSNIKSVDSLLYELGMAAIIINGYRTGRPTYVRITYNSETFANILTALTENKSNQIHKTINMLKGVRVGRLGTLGW